MVFVVVTVANPTKTERMQPAHCVTVPEVDVVPVKGPVELVSI